jgi:hypothetical protein
LEGWKVGRLERSGKGILGKEFPFPIFLPIKGLGILGMFLLAMISGDLPTF